MRPPRYTIVGAVARSSRSASWRVSRLEGCPTTGQSGKRIQRAGGWQGLDAPSNVFVMRASPQAVQSPAMKQKLTGYCSTLIEACASEGRGLVISNEEQPDV